MGVCDLQFIPLYCLDNKQSINDVRVNLVELIRIQVTFTCCDTIVSKSRNFSVSVLIP